MHKDKGIIATYKIQSDFFNDTTPKELILLQLHHYEELLQKKFKKIFFYSFKTYIFAIQK